MDLGRKDIHKREGGCQYRYEGHSRNHDRPCYTTDEDKRTVVDILEKINLRNLPNGLDLPGPQLSNLMCIKRFPGVELN